MELYLYLHTYNFQQKLKIRLQIRRTFHNEYLAITFNTTFIFSH